LDPDARYEVVLTSSSSTVSSFGFTTGSEARTRLPSIQRIVLELRAEEIEEREGGICTTEIPDRTVLVATVQVEFEAPVDAWFLIGLGFSQDEASTPPSPETVRVTAGASAFVVGTQAFRGPISLGNLERWPGPEICAAARVMRHEPMAFPCQGGSCFTPVDSITVCAPKPMVSTGCSAAATTVDAWVLLGLLASIARGRRAAS
jgi:hypothetical protein